MVLANGLDSIAECLFIGTATASGRVKVNSDVRISPLVHSMPNLSIDRASVLKYMVIYWTGKAKLPLCRDDSSTGF